LVQATFGTARGLGAFESSALGVLVNATHRHFDFSTVDHVTRIGGDAAIDGV